MTEKYYTVDEVAEYVSVSAYTVRKWCREGAMACVKIGKSFRVPESSVESFLAKRSYARPITPAEWRSRDAAI